MSLGKKTNTCSDRDYDHPHSGAECKIIKILNVILDTKDIKI